jgi:hypothetical protein
MCTNFKITLYILLLYFRIIQYDQQKKSGATMEKEISKKVRCKLNKLLLVHFDIYVNFI